MRYAISVIYENFLNNERREDGFASQKFMNLLIGNKSTKFHLFKTLYYVLFAVFVSFFGAYRIKGLFIDWLSIDLGLFHLLPVVFILILCGTYLAIRNNYGEILVGKIVGAKCKEFQQKKINFAYICLIIISFLSSLFSYKVLTFKGAGTISSRIPDNLVRVFSDIGSGFVFALLCLLLLSSFLGIVRTADYHRVSVKGIFPFLIVVIIANMLAVYYITSEKVVYCWDNLGYWIVSQSMSDLLFSDFYSFMESVNNSILTSDYNYLPIVPICVIMKVFGKSRLVYILSILNVYFIPCLWFLRITILHILSAVNIKLNKNIIYYIIMLFFPLIIFITFAGFVDAGGLIIIALTILLYLKKGIDPLQKSFAIGFLLALLYLFRRWYMFWIISFIICVFVNAVIEAMKQTENNKFKELIHRVGMVLIIPLAFGGLLTLAFQPLVVNKLLLSNYSDMYSAYNFGLSKDLGQIIKYFGAIVPILSILSLIVSIFIKEMRSKIIFFAAQIVICFLIFTRVQTHGAQHYLMYIPGMMIVMSYLLSSICRIKKKAISWGLIFLVGIMSVLNFSIPFFGTADIKNIAIRTVFNNGLFVTQKIIPRKRTDIKELQNLLNALDQLSQEGNVKIGLLASSFSLNSDTFAYFEMSLGMPESDWKKRPYIVSGSTVDQRSTTPFWLFDCDYVVLGNPPQYHLNPKDQMVVVLPTNNILQVVGFGKAFKKLDNSFKLENDSLVYIYKRIRSVSQVEAQELADQFHNLYPLLPQQYPPLAPQVPFE